MDDEIVQLSINGKNERVERPATLTELLQQLDLNPQHVAVEVNRQLVPRAQHSEYSLNDGDELEIVTLAGGG
jgi:thiamine biosynthesis protein ThiS